jgi:hypothetical protein
MLSANNPKYCVHHVGGIWSNNGFCFQGMFNFDVSVNIFVCESCSCTQAWIMYLFSFCFYCMIIEIWLAIINVSCMHIVSLVTALIPAIWVVRFCKLILCSIHDYLYGCYQRLCLQESTNIIYICASRLPLSGVYCRVLLKIDPTENKRIMRYDRQRCDASL